MKMNIPPFERELLWCHVLNVSRATLRAHPEFLSDEVSKAKVECLVEQRSQGKPMAYILGEKEFWSLPLKVNANVLIPRPETELLVQKTLELLPNNPKHVMRILDLGTGSGAIALALAHERPSWKITATDRSEKALEVAKLNAQRLKIDNVNFYPGNWYDALVDLGDDKNFDAIISNPPYIPKTDPHLQMGDCRFEPLEALSAGQDGLADLKQIIAGAALYLIPHGLILVEHGYDQGQAVFDLINQHHFKNIQHVKDLAQHDRVVIGQKCL